MKKKIMGLIAMIAIMTGITSCSNGDSAIAFTPAQENVAQGEILNELTKKVISSYKTIWTIDIDLSNLDTNSTLYYQSYTSTRDYTNVRGINPSGDTPFASDIPEEGIVNSDHITLEVFSIRWYSWIGIPVSYKIEKQDSYKIATTDTDFGIKENVVLKYTTTLDQFTDKINEFYYDHQ